MSHYFYPRLSTTDFSFFRVGGPGLANCLFIAAQAYIAAQKGNGIYIEPTWRKISIGPWLRNERDKRVYNNLFKTHGITGLKKWLVLLGIKLNILKCTTIDGLNEYFSEINTDYSSVKLYFDTIVKSDVVKDVKTEELQDIIAVHVRLGDYLPHLRIPVEWYKGVINNIIKRQADAKFYLFSDGTDEELQELIDIPNVRRRFYGNAFADMWAISKCKLLIASDSTFSAWGAFLGKVPILFNRRHFPPVYSGDIAEFVIGDSIEVPDDLMKLVF